MLSCAYMSSDSLNSLHDVMCTSGIVYIALSLNLQFRFRGNELGCWWLP